PSHRWTWKLRGLAAERRGGGATSHRWTWKLRGLAAERRGGSAPSLETERGSSPVELLIASTLGMLVVAAAVSLLRAHAGLALDVQAALGASGGAGWALRTALRDVQLAG